MAPLPGVIHVKGDFRDDDVLDALEAALEGRKVDLVVSDLAPNLSGIESADQARAVHLGELALEFATRWLEPGGDLVVKAFQGEGFQDFAAGGAAAFRQGLRPQAQGVARPEPRGVSGRKGAEKRRADRLLAANVAFRRRCGDVGRWPRAS